jgi:hypothetical protein
VRRYVAARTLFADQFRFTTGLLKKFVQLAKKRFTSVELLNSLPFTRGTTLHCLELRLIFLKSFLVLAFGLRLSVPSGTPLEFPILYKSRGNKSHELTPVF